MRPKILVTRKISDYAEELLKKEFDATLNIEDKPIPSVELAKIVNKYDGMISTGWDTLGKSFFENIDKKVKIISQVGVGYDNIALENAKKKKH